jgi:hypothetical protein
MELLLAHSVLRQYRTSGCSWSAWKAFNIWQPLRFVCLPSEPTPIVRLLTTWQLRPAHSLRVHFTYLTQTITAERSLCAAVSVTSDRDFPPCHCPDLLRDPSSLLLKYRRLFWGGKRPSRETDCSIESSAGVKMRGIIPPLLLTHSWNMRSVLCWTKSVLLQCICRVCFLGEGRGM